ncbi:hypothetical protein DF268_23300 [Streptomyces sp. V2]|nr:hypothetical protein DF268_23300 [Streptomyces sp. V2]
MGEFEDEALRADGGPGGGAPWRGGRGSAPSEDGTGRGGGGEETSVTPRTAPPTPAEPPLSRSAATQWPQARAR